MRTLLRVFERLKMANESRSAFVDVLNRRIKRESIGRESVCVETTDKLFSDLLRVDGLYSSLASEFQADVSLEVGRISHAYDSEAPMIRDHLPSGKIAIGIRGSPLLDPDVSVSITANHCS